MKNLITRFIQEEEGQDLVEYILLIVFIALTVTAGMTALAVGINSKFDQVVGSLT